MRFDVGTFGFRDVFQTDMLRLGGGDVGGNIGGELLEIVGASDEIGFAIHFDQDAEFAIRADGSSDETLLGAAGFFIAGAGDPFLAKRLQLPADCRWLPRELFCNPSCPRQYVRGVLLQVVR